MLLAVCGHRRSGDEPIRRNGARETVIAAERTEIGHSGSRRPAVRMDGTSPLRLELAGADDLAARTDGVRERHVAAE